MGEVYRARDTRLGRDVALKVLPGSFASDPERLARFEQEARAAAALNHPNIIAVHDLGQHAGAPFIVTELLDGMSLQRMPSTTANRPSKSGTSCAGCVEVTRATWRPNAERYEPSHLFDTPA